MITFLFLTLMNIKKESRVLSLSNHIFTFLLLLLHFSLSLTMPTSIITTVWTGSPLAMSDVLIDTLSNINDSELLCTEAKCIRQIINMQLDGIDPLVDPSSTLNTEKDKEVRYCLLYPLLGR